MTLLNLERPTVWDEVSHWIEKHGEITNAELCKIAGMDTLNASKKLKLWVAQSLLKPLPGRGKRNMAYAKPEHESEQASLLSEALDNKLENQ